MKRIIKPEWLDELSADDPRAIGSRNDITRLNRITGNEILMRGLLRAATGENKPRRIVEIGAGNGSFMLRLARHFSRDWPAVELVLLDCKESVTDETRRGFEALGWKIGIVAADVFDWLKKDSGPADLLLANLFLHQFSETQLTAMFALIAARTKAFAACEPRRAALPLALSRLVGLIGCNAVTRNDAPLSVQAGFTGQEISALWLTKKNDWRVEEKNSGFSSHTFLAQRIAG
jgi:hypothetical protein